MTSQIITAAGVLLTAGSANAAFFSFASDEASNDWTFQYVPPTTSGLPGTILDGSRGSPPRDLPLNLLIDDDNGVLPTIELESRFQAEFAVEHVASVDLTPALGYWSHLYSVSGSFSFRLVDGGPDLLMVEVENALLTAAGGEFSWDSAGAIIGSDGTASVTYTATQGLIDAVGGEDTAAQYGLAVGSSEPGADFGFDLTVINEFGDRPLPAGLELGAELDPQTLLPIARWFSEGSFSGSATIIPAPGSVVLLAMGGVAAARRRRG
ncbi:MAG: hypothetical protein AAGG07_11085 [Planctomycetota bacterium]